MEVSQVSTVNKEQIRQRVFFHQENPHHICQQSLYKTKAKCRSPRCSLACRQNFAFQKAEILIWQLERISGRYQIYFGNLDIHQQITKEDHKRIRSQFCDQLKGLQREHQCEIKFYAVSEIGDDLKVHYHYAMYSSVPVTQNQIKSLWSAACSGMSTTVQHRPPQVGIRQAAKYMFKDLKGVRQRNQFIRLFDYDTMQITWGSRPFFEIPQKEIWKLLCDQWYGKPNDESQDNVDKENKAEQDNDWQHPVSSSAIASITSSIVSNARAPPFDRCHRLSPVKRGYCDELKYDQHTKLSNRPDPLMAQRSGRIGHHTLTEGFRIASALMDVAVSLLSCLFYFV